jgi:branched-chain amino acid transport system substrate-binding protein
VITEKRAVADGRSDFWNKEVEMQSKWKSSVLLAVVIAMLVGIAVAEEDPIKIGALMALTGGLGPYGPSIADGARMAVDRINAAGGVMGRQLELVLRDSATSPDVGRDAASKLVELDGVTAIVGALSSGVTLAVSSVTIPAEVVLISPASTAPSIPALDDNDFVFRTVVSDEVQGVVLGRLAVLLNYSNVAVVFVNNDYGKGLADTFAATFEALGGTVSSKVPYEENKPSYRGEVDRLLAGEPEAIMMACYPVDGNKQIVEAVEAGYTGDFLMTDGMKGEGVAPGPGCISAASPGPLEGAFGTVAAAGFKAEQFEADFDAGGYGPSTIPYHDKAFDAVMLIALAMVRAGDTSGPAIRDNLRAVANPPGEMVYYNEWEKAVALLQAGKEINYQGAAGLVDFKDTGDVDGAIEIWKIENCQVVRVMEAAG